MKKIILIIAVLAIAFSLKAQQYHYFILHITTSIITKGYVVITEGSENSKDMDSIIFLPAGQKGAINLRSYKSVTEAFNTLSAAGFEFVQSDLLESPHTIWRKKVQQ